MLTAFILGTNASNVDYFHRCCLGVRDLSIPHILDVRPPLHQLVRMLNTHLPQVVFLEVDQHGQSFQTAVDILVAAPGTTVIGFGHEASDELLAEAREFGIEDILPAPYEDREVFVVIQTAMKSPASQSRPVVAFQPATGGCGASTIALNVASTLANQFKRKVLLIDADLRSSPLPFWFSHDPEPTIVEALNACDNLTERSWQQMIWNARGVDMLLTGRRRSVAAPSFSSRRMMRTERPFASEHGCAASRQSRGTTSSCGGVVDALSTTITSQANPFGSLHDSSLMDRSVRDSRSGRLRVGRMKLITGEAHKRWFGVSVHDQPCVGHVLEPPTQLRRANDRVAEPR